jgi:hypothetical protein
MEAKVLIEGWFHFVCFFGMVNLSSHTNGFVLQLNLVLFFGLFWISAK